MKNKVMKPKIRFKGFTDTWEQRKFSRLANVRRGLTYSPIDILKNGVRVLRSSNIQEDKFIYSEDDVFVNKNAINIDYVKNNDILITSANGSTRLVGKHALISGLPSSSAVHGGFMLLATANENPEFLNASMSSSWYSKFIELFVSGGNGAIGNLSKSDLDEQEILVPSSEEQRKLGQLFKMIDNLITLHQRKYDKLVNIKKALLEKMFPKKGKNVPKIRFKGFTDTWEQRKLGEIANIIMGQSPDGINYTDNPTDNILIQGNADLYNGIVVPRIWTTQITKISKPNDIIFTVRAPVGEVAKNTYTAVIGRGVASISGNDFLYQTLKKMKEFDYWSKLSAGSTFDSINSEQLKNSEINIPLNEEQKQIGNFLEKIDNLITLHQRKLEKLKNIKKSLLNKMFV